MISVKIVFSDEQKTFNLCETAKLSSANVRPVLRVYLQRDAGHAVPRAALTSDFYLNKMKFFPVFFSKKHKIYMLINLIVKDDKKPVENELPAHHDSLIDENSRCDGLGGNSKLTPDDVKISFIIYRNLVESEFISSLVSLVNIGKNLDARLAVKIFIRLFWS